MFDRKPDIASATDPAAAKDPDDWTTGDERMTGAQRSYLQTLAQADRPVAGAHRAWSLTAGSRPLPLLP
jgi:hypothetical protein